MSKKSSKKIYIRVYKPIEVGDLVRCVRDDGECKPGDVRRVGEVSGNHLWLLGCWGGHEKSRWEPVRKEVRVSENRRAEMERAIGDMIVELLDRENADWSNVGISINPERRKTVVMDVKRSGVAICSHRDNPDTLTGVYVALSKATGRKLPDWIYGEEK